MSAEVVSLRSLSRVGPATVDDLGLTPAQLRLSHVPPSHSLCELKTHLDHVQSRFLLEAFLLAVVIKKRDVRLLAKLQAWAREQGSPLAEQILLAASQLLSRTQSTHPDVALYEALSQVNTQTLSTKFAELQLEEGVAQLPVNLILVDLGSEGRRAELRGSDSLLQLTCLKLNGKAYFVYDREKLSAEEREDRPRTKKSKKYEGDFSGFSHNIELKQFQSTEAQATPASSSYLTQTIPRKTVDYGFSPPDRGLRDAESQCASIQAGQGQATQTLVFSKEVSVSTLQLVMRDAWITAKMLGISQQTETKQVELIDGSMFTQLRGVDSACLTDRAMGVAVLVQASLLSLRDVAIQTRRSQQLTQKARCLCCKEYFEGDLELSFCEECHPAHQQRGLPSMRGERHRRSQFQRGTRSNYRVEEAIPQEQFKPFRWDFAASPISPKADSSERPEQRSGSRSIQTRDFGSIEQVESELLSPGREQLLFRRDKRCFSPGK